MGRVGESPSGEHYEDDGISQAYEDDYAITTFKKRCSESSCIIEIGPRIGQYEGMPEDRNFTIVMGGLDRKPKSVVMDGGSVLDCQYDSAKREAIFTLPSMLSEGRCKIVVRY